MNLRHTAALALIGWLMLPLPLAAEGPVAVPGTADAEMTPSSSPLVVRGTADTPPKYENELRLRVDLLTRKCRLLLDRIKWNRTRRRAAGRKPDIEELKEERKDLDALDALERDVTKNEAQLHAIAEEGRASHVSAPSAH